MQNNKTNPIVIVLLVIAVVLLVYIAFDKKEIADNTFSTNQRQNSDIKETDQQQVSKSDNSNVKSAYGITITVPDGFIFDSSLNDFNTKLVTVGSSVNNHMAVSFVVYPSLIQYNEDTQIGNDIILSNANYRIGGTTGKFYTSKDGLESYVFVPSKLMVVSISPASFVGVSQTVIDEMVNSIKFN